MSSPEDIQICKTLLLSSGNAQCRRQTWRDHTVVLYVLLDDRDVSCENSDQGAVGPHGGAIRGGFREEAVIVELDHKRYIHFTRWNKKNILSWGNYTVSDSKVVYIRTLFKKLVFLFVVICLHLDLVCSIYFCTGNYNNYNTAQWMNSHHREYYPPSFSLAQDPLSSISLFAPMNQRENWRSPILAFLIFLIKPSLRSSC